MGIALAFQLGVAPLLAQLDVLGDARWAIPAVAISRIDGAEGILASLPLARRDRDHPRLGRRRTRRRALANPHARKSRPHLRAWPRRLMLRRHPSRSSSRSSRSGSPCRSRRRACSSRSCRCTVHRASTARCGTACGAAALIAARAAGEDGRPGRAGLDGRALRGPSWPRRATWSLRRAAAARERELLGEAAAAEERLRIARELHDAVGHDVSLMVVQAEALAAVTGDERADAIAALGRRTMGEMHRTLKVLRDEGGARPATRAGRPRRRDRGRARAPACRSRSRSRARRARSRRPGRERVPDRAGGRDQRDPPRGRRGRERHRPLRRRRARAARDRRGRRAEPRRQRRARPDRHARAGRRLRRHARRRPAHGARLRSPGGASRTH